MDVDLLFPSRFIKAADLQGKDVTLEIESVVGDELEGDKGKQFKGIVSFKGKKKKWVLNRTNALCLKAMFGRETDAWTGHKVTIYPSTFNDEPCIRVKGSPELEKPLEFELKLPRKKPKITKMLPTGKGAVVEAFDDGVTTEGTVTA
jgi:hypothetical protein